MQLFGLDWPITSVQDLLDRKKEIIKKTNQNDIESIALLCLIYCTDFQEEKALKLIPKIVNQDQKKCLGQILINHFYCYVLISEKFNIPSTKFKHLYQNALNYFRSVPDPSIGITIGASLIVKNEAKFLENCLKSLQEVVDEIVIVDTGSTDKTLDIAKKYNVKLSHFEWCNDFSAARNAALALNTTHWILVIDADEEFIPDSLYPLLEGVARPHYGGYNIKIKNQIYKNDTNNLFMHEGLRLFQRLPGVCFIGKIHEQIAPSLVKNKYATRNLNNLYLYHWGYIEENVVDKNKHKRTLELLLNEVKNDPTHSFHWFNLANTYFCKKMWQECIKASEKSACYLIPEAPYLEMLYYNWSMAYVKLGEMEEALSTCDQFEQKKKNSCFILNYVKSSAYLELDKKEKALEAIELYFNSSEALLMLQNDTIEYYKACFLKGKILLSLNRHEDSIKTFNETLAQKPDVYPAIFLRGVAYLHIGQSLKALQNFIKIERNPIYTEEVKPLIAQCYFKMDQPKEAIKSLKNISKDLTLSEELLIDWFAHVQGSEDSLEIQYRFNQLKAPSKELRINYGRALIYFELYHLAEEQFKSTLIENELNTNALFNLGDLYLKTENYLESKKYYEKGLVLEKNNIDAWLNLGNCFFALNNYLKAIDCYEEVLTRCPTHHAALQNLQIMISNLKAS